MKEYTTEQNIEYLLDRVSELERQDLDYGFLIANMLYRPDHKKSSDYATEWAKNWLNDTICIEEEDVKIDIAIRENKKKMKEHIKLYERCVDAYCDDNFEIPYSSEKYKFMELRRNLIWLSKSIQGSTDLRIKISKTKTLEELNQIINYLN